MSEGAGGISARVYLGTLGLLALALAFPIGLMVLNPTLMFERGWEQYVGTALYLWAVLTLGRELKRLWVNERSFQAAPELLTAWKRGQEKPGQAPLADRADDRVLPARLRQLGASASGGKAISATQLMELNREASSLDQEQAAGRFTLTRYILYLLPVIGFIGTVEGISMALLNISRVLPMVKELDGFLNNLTSVTSALQIAFDSTLLALFLSAALMLVQTLVYRRAEDLLARVDRWVVEHVLPRAGHESPQAAAMAEAMGPFLERLQQELAQIASQTAASVEALGERLGAGLGPHIARFADTVDRLPPAVAQFQVGAEAVGRLANDMEVLTETSRSAGRAAASLARIEAALAESGDNDEQLAAILQGIDRTRAAVETLSASIAHSFERSSRATQEQLARTLNNLKEALELLNVSMEQGTSLYRSIVKKLVPTSYATVGDDQAA
jgi:biopolymer transport protein ExbB/TolQ